MGKTQTLIKNTFDDYFDRLKTMADTVEELKQLLRVCDAHAQPEIRRLISELEDELKRYAEGLRSGGTEILNRVA